MANQQNGEQPKLNDSLRLNYPTRNRLATSITQLTTILKCGKPISDTAKNKLSQSISELIQLLVDLQPVKLAQTIDDSMVVERIVDGRLIFGISRAERSAAIVHLLNLKDFIIDSAANSETKDSLIAENKRIFDGLLELPYQVYESEQDDENEQQRSR